MSKRLLTLSAAAMVAASIAAVPNDASAAPFADALAIKNAAGSAVETVQWRGGGFGWGLGAGLLGGAIIGGALAAPYYYGPGYYPPAYYGPGYYPAPAYGYGAPGYGGDGVAYCARRYRSYDPGSGTFLGNDGLRHSCP
jgi:hypothetical protein